MPLVDISKRGYFFAREFYVLLPDGKMRKYDMNDMDMGCRFSRVVNGKSVCILVPELQLGEQTNTLRFNRGEFVLSEDESDDLDEMNDSECYGIEYGNLTPERMKEVLREILVKKSLDLSGIRQIHEESQIGDGAEYLWIGDESRKHCCQWFD